MRIGYDASPVRGNRTGVEHYTVRLLEALRGLDDVEIVAFSDLAVPDLPEVVVRPSRMPLALWRQVVLPRLVRDAGCTSFHSAVTAMSLRLRIPVVATLHDLAWAIMPDCYLRRERAKQRFWLWAACRWAARLVCVSDATRRDVLDRFPAAEKTVTIHNGAVAAPLDRVDEASVRSARDQFGLRGRYLLAVGRVEERKNPVAVVRAFAEATCDPGLDDVQLVFAGTLGDAADEARATAAALGVADRVVFCSYVAGQEISALYQSAKALVYASRYEGFGHPPFEALSLGTPVIAADIPAIREVLGDGGELVALDSPGALAMALRRVLSDAGYRTDLLGRGRARLERFSWRTTAEAVTELHRAWA